MVVQHHTEGGMAEVDNLRWKYINDLKYKFKKNCFTDLVGSSFVFEHRLSLIKLIFGLCTEYF